MEIKGEFNPKDFHMVILPRAFKNIVGKEVPVNLPDGTKTLGTIIAIDDVDEGIEITFEVPDEFEETINKGNSTGYSYSKE